MGDDKKSRDQQPGEQPPGKFHYNPGNMAGKTVNDATDPQGERTNSDETVKDLDEDASRKGRAGPPEKR